MHLTDAYASASLCPLATSLHHGANFLSISLQFPDITKEGKNGQKSHPQKLMPLVLI